MAADNRRSLDHIQQFNLAHETEGMSLVPTGTVGADGMVLTRQVRKPVLTQLTTTPAASEVFEWPAWVKPAMLLGLGGVAILVVYLAIRGGKGKRAGK